MRIEKRNNKGYMYNSCEDWDQPRIITSYWLINIDSDLIPENAIIEKLDNAYIINTDWKILSLNINELPDFTEFTPIKPPKKSGYIWKYGHWIKQ